MNESAAFSPRSAASILLVGRDYVTIHVSGSQTGGAYALIELASKPGSAIPLHVHAFREAYVVLEGEYEFMWEDDGGRHAATATPGASLAVPSSVPHGYGNRSGEMARMIALLTPGGFEQFFEDVGARVERVGDVPLGDYQPLRGVHFVEALRRYGLQVVAG